MLPPLQGWNVYWIAGPFLRIEKTHTVQARDAANACYTAYPQLGEFWQGFIAALPVVSDCLEAVALTLPEPDLD